MYIMEVVTWLQYIPNDCRYALASKVITYACGVAENPAMVKILSMLSVPLLSEQVYIYIYHTCYRYIITYIYICVCVCVCC